MRPLGMHRGIIRKGTRVIHRDTQKPYIMPKDHYTALVSRRNNMFDFFYYGEVYQVHADDVDFSSIL